MSGILRRVAKNIAAVPAAVRYRGLCTRDSTYDVLFDIRKFHYGRYFYSLVKCLNLEGQRVAVRNRLETVFDIHHAQYGCEVFAEQLVELAGGNVGGRTIGDSNGCEKHLSPYTFDVSMGLDAAGGVFRVPMLQHPIMYSSGMWNQSFPIPSAPKHILFAGNVDETLYPASRLKNLFGVVDRVTLFKKLLELSRKLEATGSGAGNERLTLIDTAKRSISFQGFRPLLSQYRFFVCAPGVFMPLCHNFVEAISTGAIPIVQRNYAKLLPRGIADGENAMIFEGESDFLDVVEQCFHITSSQADLMRRSAETYYNTNFHPAVVVKHLLSDTVRRVELLAGRQSVAVFANRGHS